MCRQDGFSLVELTVSTALTLAIMAAAFAMIVPSQAAFAAQSEAGDMQQRLRVVVSAFERDLGAAGMASLEIAAVRPYRVSTVDPDPPGSMRRDTIALLTGSPAAPTVRNYSLKSDSARGIYQLVVDDGLNPAAPVADHVVALSFDYFGEPQPPMLRQTTPSTTAGSWMTYGPKPPTTPEPFYALGENCVIAFGAAADPVPRLATFGPAGAPLVHLTPEMLRDGPWCPDGASPLRWDADLLRIRAVDVTVRVQSALAALRGPAGPLFTHGGTSRGGHTWLPDLEARVRIAPRNLNVAR